MGRGPVVLVLSHRQDQITPTCVTFELSSRARTSAAMALMRARYDATGKGTVEWEAAHTSHHKGRAGP